MQRSTRQENFDISFSVFFYRYRQCFISKGKTGHWTMSLPSFEIFFRFSNLPRSPRSLVVLQLVQPLVDQVYTFIRYQAPFYFW